MKYIGVDLGTSSVKIILMDASGNVCDSVSRDYPIEFPKPGWSQQNPEDWFEQTVAGIKELLAGKDKAQIAGISFGGQMHGLVILDRDDRVIRPALLWNDGRSEAEADYLNNVIGRDKLSSYTGNIAFAGFTAAKLLWVYNHEPDNFARIRKIMLPKDYIAYRLSGVHCTDMSDASGMLLLDVSRRKWSEEMMEICHVKECWLPKLYESYECVGKLLPSAARELGLPDDVKIIAGAGDNAAAAIANGIVGDGMCNISLGTSGTVFISGNEFRVDDNNALHSFGHADGRYHLMGCMLSAASCNKWWMEDILGSSDFTTEQDKIKNLGDNHVFFLPYLMGERSPHNNPSARAAFVGMTMDTGRTEMLQAVMEGVVFALRDSIEVAKKLGYSLAVTRVCGGGAKSRLWVRMIANILNMNVEILRHEEGPGLGAAMLAAVGCGEYRDVREAAEKIVRVKEVITPDAKLVKKYDKKYQMFKSIYPQLVSVYELMRE